MDQFEYSGEILGRSKSDNLPRYIIVDENGRLQIVHVDTDGDEKFTDTNPSNTKTSGLDTFDKTTLNQVLATKNHKSEVVAIDVDGDSYKTSFSEEYSTAQTGTAIITPTSGYRVCVRNVHVATNGSTGDVKLDFLTSGKKVSRLYVDKRNRDWFSLGCLAGNVDEPLSLTTTTGTDKVFILINYIERP